MPDQAAGCCHDLDPSSGANGQLPPPFGQAATTTHQDYWQGTGPLPMTQSCPMPAASPQALTPLYPHAVSNGGDALVTPPQQQLLPRARTTGGGMPSSSSLSGWGRLRSTRSTTGRSSGQPSLRRSMEERLPRELRRRLTEEFGSQRTKKLKTFNDLHTWSVSMDYIYIDHSLCMNDSMKSQSNSQGLFISTLLFTCLTFATVSFLIICSPACVALQAGARGSRTLLGTVDAHLQLPGPLLLLLHGRSAAGIPPVALNGNHRESRMVSSKTPLFDGNIHILNHSSASCQPIPSAVTCSLLCCPVVLILHHRF